METPSLIVFLLILPFGEGTGIPLSSLLQGTDMGDLQRDSKKKMDELVQQFSKYIEYKEVEHKDTITSLMNQFQVGSVSAPTGKVALIFTGLHA